MALAPDFQSILDGYTFNKTETEALSKYLFEEAEQLEIEAYYNEADFTNAHDYYTKLTDNVKSFVEESNSYMTSWHYGTLDMVEALRDIINELERSKI